MGLIQAVAGSVGGVLADQWKDFYTVPDGLPSTAALFAAVPRGTNAGRGSNTSGSANIITNGSKIVVPEGYGLLLMQDGAITCFAAESGGYEWRYGPAHRRRAARARRGIEPGAHDLPLQRVGVLKFVEQDVAVAAVELVLHVLGVAGAVEQLVDAPFHIGEIHRPPLLLEALVSSQQSRAAAQAGAVEAVSSLGGECIPHRRKALAQMPMQFEQARFALRSEALRLVFA